MSAAEFTAAETTADTHRRTGGERSEPRQGAEQSPVAEFAPPDRSEEGSEEGVSPTNVRPKGATDERREDKRGVWSAGRLRSDRTVRTC